MSETSGGTAPKGLSAGGRLTSKMGSELRFHPTRRATSTIAEVIWAISAGGQMYGGIA
jgi:hypothetical protein